MNDSNTLIYVTKPSLPPLEEFIPLLQEIWNSQRLTNDGPFHQQLERELARYLDVPYISLFNNGTIALMVALQALEITGEVITTPYSFVATSHALLWRNLTPVFVDIEETSFNLDPSKIEAAITPRTSAILPVHCYGNPCNIEYIREIADKNGLKVIYDAAHAFGVKTSNQSVLGHGDLSVLSFHATKIFNTFEGGAIVSHRTDMKQRIDLLKNFGFADELTVLSAGINGKMSEINAAFGLLQLNHVEQSIAHSLHIDSTYRKGLDSIEGIACPQKQTSVKYNNSYFPILVQEEYPLTRDELYDKLKSHGIYSRRYFYPLISNMPMYSEMSSASKTNLPVANKRAEQVLCLPIYENLSDDDTELIISLIKDV